MFLLGIGTSTCIQFNQEVDRKLDYQIVIPVIEYSKRKIHIVL